MRVGSSSVLPEVVALAEWKEPSSAPRNCWLYSSVPLQPQGLSQQMGPEKAQAISQNGTIDQASPPPRDVTTSVGQPFPQRFPSIPSL